MPKNRYYYYDHEACTFVEVKAKRSRIVFHAATVFAVSLVITLVGFSGFSSTFGTPQEQALRAENEALSSQLVSAQKRMKEFSSRLEQLADADRRLYRTLLQVDPIPDEVRQVGVGGVDQYREFNRFGAETSSLLRHTSESLDKMERELNLQNASFRDLFRHAREWEERIRQLPAILPANGIVVSGYGQRHHPIYRALRMHHGIDIVLDIGTPIYATADGDIEFAGASPGYGYNIQIRHPKTGYTTLYAHLSSIPSNIRKGVKVKRGDQIALSGNTGRSTGPHLHYEVRDSEGRTLNPVYFFAPSMTPHEYQKLLEAAENSTTSLD